MAKTPTYNFNYVSPIIEIKEETGSLTLTEFVKDHVPDLSKVKSWSFELLSTNTGTATEGVNGDYTISIERITNAVTGTITLIEDDTFIIEDDETIIVLANGQLIYEYIDTNSELVTETHKGPIKVNFVIKEQGFTDEAETDVNLNSFEVSADVIKRFYDSKGGNDVVILHNDISNTNFYAGTGDDTITGGTSNDIIRGEAGNDKLFGGIGNDSLYGGSGDDTLYGADHEKLTSEVSGENELHGGAGFDTVVFDTESFVFTKSVSVYKMLFVSLLGGSSKDEPLKIAYGSNALDIIHSDVEEIQFKDRTYTITELRGEAGWKWFANEAFPAINGAIQDVIDDIELVPGAKFYKFLTFIKIASNTIEYSLKVGDVVYDVATTTSEFKQKAFIVATGDKVVNEILDKAIETVNDDNNLSDTVKEFLIGRMETVQADAKIIINNIYDGIKSLLDGLDLEEQVSLIMATFKQKFKEFSDLVKEGQKVFEAIESETKDPSLDQENPVVELTLKDKDGEAIAFKSLTDDYTPVDSDEELFLKMDTPDTKAEGGNKDDLIIGSDGDDEVHAKAGDDVMSLGAGDDKGFGGDGDDIISGGTGDDELNAGKGDDKVTDTLGNDELNGDDGRDALITLSGSNKLNGGDDSDLLIGGFGGDILTGGAGNDVIIGDASQILGGSDLLEGGTGNDILMGGLGADKFKFNTNDGNDIIGQFKIDKVNFDSATGYSATATAADFQLGIDHIELNGFTTTNASNVLDFITQTDDGAVFSHEGTEITLFGIDANQLSSSDFVFS